MKKLLTYIADVLEQKNYSAPELFVVQEIRTSECVERADPNYIGEEKRVVAAYLFWVNKVAEYKDKGQHGWPHYLAIVQAKKAQAQIKLNHYQHKMEEYHG